MTELMTALTEFNDVKYSAYRTGLKLRTVQQKLCMDLMYIDSLINIFDQHGLRAQNDKLISVSDIIGCLQNIYNELAQQHPKIVNVSLCIDLCLNWLLNLYDT